MGNISKQRVCIIGAGLAGLTSGKYLQDEGINFIILEATKYFGGTWRYDPRVGYDENGLPLHTSMYKHLRTNLPKPTMELRGFPVPKDMPSFPKWSIYYEYIKDYVKHFGLEKRIMFEHNVELVSRVGDAWRVKYKNLVSGENFEQEFDFVIVGTGHYSDPNLPDVPHEDLFKGTIMHSHDYREPDRFKDRRVLIVGAGPSGMDIAIDVAYVSKTLVHSHHSPGFGTDSFPQHYIQKPDIREYNETGVIFKDGTYEEIDDVIYCTGYKYNYTFLDDSCGLTVTPRSVTPLYKYMVNVNQPTMMVMGLIVKACVVVALDAQSRYATALIKGNFTLPPKEAMMAEFQNRLDDVMSKGRPISDVHFLSDKEDDYYMALTAESGIDRVPPVMFKIRKVDTKAKLDDIYTYRNYAYSVIDDSNFVRTLENNT
ncbi:senecionine N-oxygenase-like isoform X2 [Danaus plexippus]|uniref:senecionine N-oxygenase-like isoform X2 n=1 Tax=Danaus plexippus TaxID=13037 RepID=UPI002AB00DF7|nr:senecionine N-oxygenase-like isoform X2 [Danaus plexippus]XP_032521488.2 senecionine N-oxygenase-like isoform X2 [Danaus plexippus]